LPCSCRPAGTGYFVAQDFAHVSGDRLALARETEAGGRRAARAPKVLERLSFMLSGAQLGITVTRLVVGFIAEPSVSTLIKPALSGVGLPDAAVTGLSVVLAFVGATVVQMVLGELAPKNLVDVHGPRVGLHRRAVTDGPVREQSPNPPTKSFGPGRTSILRIPEPAAFLGQQSYLEAGPCAQLSTQIADMGLNGPATEPQGARDGVVLHPRGHQAKDVPRPTLESAFLSFGARGGRSAPVFQREGHRALPHALEKGGQYFQECRGVHDK